MNNKKAGWNHSKAIIIIIINNFYYRFQTSSMHILLEVDYEKNALVTRERAHSRDRLQKES